MAAYKQEYFTWIGHSVNDTAPTASTVTGHFRYDTDLVLLSYSNGTSWVPIAYGPSAVIEVFNKTMDIRQNTLLRMARYGVYTPSYSGVTAEGEGILKGLIGIGTRGTSVSNTGGKYDIWNTRAVINDCAGVVKLDSFTAWRTNNALFRFAFLFPGNTTNRRMFKGVGAKRLINTDSDTAPLNSDESGFFFGYAPSDTFFQIFHNDATGTCVKDATSIAIPGVATNYVLEIQMDNSTPLFRYSLYGVVSPGSRGTLLGTGTINTRIPASTTSVYLQDLVAATSAGVQPNNIHYVEAFA